MKKLFFFLVAIAVAFTANAKVINVEPGENTLLTAVADAQAGDELVLTTGVYSLESTQTIVSTAEGLIVKAAEGATPVIEIPGAWSCFKTSVATTFDGLVFDGKGTANYLIALVGAEEVGAITIKNCEFKNWKKYAISKQYEAISVSSLTVDNCLFHDGTSSAIHFNESAPAGKHGCNNLTVTNSTFYNITTGTDWSGVIQAYSNGESTGDQNKVLIDHITMYNFDAANVGALVFRKTENVQISNSIIAAATNKEHYAIHIYYGKADNVLYHNSILRTDKSAVYTNCNDGDPKFVDAANGNFALAEGSPAIGAGTDSTNLGDPRWNVAKPVLYNVTVTAENGTVTGAGEYEKGATATLTATPAEGYEFINWLVDDVEVSDVNPYTFTVTANVEVVANFDLIPVVEPEKPEPTYTENNLNPFAFGLESELVEGALNVTYRLNNSNATSVNVIVYNGEEVVATVPGTTTIGKNTVEVPTADLPGGVELTWSVEVNGTSVEVPTQEKKNYGFYCPHGLAIDTNPESENFGRILVAEAMHGNTGTKSYVSHNSEGKQQAGLYTFNPSFTTDSVVYTGGLDFTRIWAGQGYQPWRVKISEDGRIFVSSLDLNGVAVWEVSKDLQTWTPVIAGTQDENGTITDAEGNFIAGMNVSMDVKGSGEDLTLLLYSCTTNASSFALSAYRLDEYHLGTATTFTGTPKNIVTGGYAIVHTNAEFIYDGEGGYWFGASRSNTQGTPAKNLAHINAEGVEDYSSTESALYGGDGVLVHNGMLFKGKARTSSSVGNFGVWTIGKDANGKVTLTEKWTVAANGIGRNLNEFAVDYAENLYVVGNSGEMIIAYALPYSGKVETPAASKYAFQLEGQAIEYTEIVMSNLVVTPYGAYDLLEASAVMTGIAVMLGVDAEGNLVEGSEVTWSGTSMTILSSGVFTKAYNDELATDVYNGKLVIDLMGSPMGLDLYMYGTGAAASVDVVITDANIAVDEWGSYVVTANWGEGTLTCEVSDTEYEGFMMIEYNITEDDWYRWMSYTATVTTVDNVMTIEGEFMDNYTGTTYNVTISGNLNNTGTGVDNATVTIKPVKMLKNGQVIIIKNGVQYTIQGQVIK